MDSSLTNMSLFKIVPLFEMRLQFNRSKKHGKTKPRKDSQKRECLDADLKLTFIY